MKQNRIIYLLGFIGFGISTTFSAQSTDGKTGVLTLTPTENLDVNGTIRVRNLPNDNSSYTKPDNTTANFVAVHPIASSDTHGVIGKGSTGTLVPNNTTPDFRATTLNNSKSMFVIRRVSIKDYPSGGVVYNGVPNPNVDTGMNVDDWQPVMSSVGYKYTKIDQIDNVFRQSKLFGWTIFAKGPTWHIAGDQNGIQETSDTVDILFINKKVVAADTRSAVYAY